MWSQYRIFLLPALLIAEECSLLQRQEKDEVAVDAQEKNEIVADAGPFQLVNGAETPYPKAWEPHCLVQVPEEDSVFVQPCWLSQGQQFVFTEHGQLRHAHKDLCVTVKEEKLSFQKCHTSSKQHFEQETVEGDYSDVPYAHIGFTYLHPKGATSLCMHWNRKGDSANRKVTMVKCLDEHGMHSSSSLWRPFRTGALWYVAPNALESSADEAKPVGRVGQELGMVEAGQVSLGFVFAKNGELVVNNPFDCLTAVPWKNNVTFEVELQLCQGKTHQQWLGRPSEKGGVISTIWHPDLCLDYDKQGLHKKGNLYLSECNGKATQRFFWMPCISESQTCGD